MHLLPAQKKVRSHDNGTPEPSVAQRLFHGSLWSLIGAVGAQGFTLVASVIAARILGKVEFGQFNFLQGTVGTAAVFAGSGLGLTATRYVASYRREDPRRTAEFITFVMNIVLTMSALAALIMLVGAPYIAVSIFNVPRLTPSIRWAALNLFCVTVNGVQCGILAGLESFRSVAQLNIVRGLSILILSVPFLWFWRLEGAVAAMGIAGAIVYGTSLVQVASVMRAHGIATRAKMDWRHAPVLWKFSLPAVLAGIVVTPVTWLSSLWLSRQPHGYGELGLFGAANQWRIAVSFLPVVLSQPLVPVLTSLTNKKENSFDRVVLYCAGFNGAAALAVGGIILFGLPFISALYGRSYVGLNSVLIPLLIAGTLASAAVPIGNALASTERMWVGFGINLIWGCCLLLMAYFAIPKAGARGLGYSFLGAYVLHMFTTIYCMRRFARFKPANPSGPWKNSVVKSERDLIPCLMTENSNCTKN